MGPFNTTAITLEYNRYKRVEFSVPYNIVAASLDAPQEVHILISIRNNLGKGALFPYSTFNPVELSTILQTLAKQKPQPNVRIILTDTLQRHNEEDPDNPESSKKYIRMVGDLFLKWFGLTIDVDKLPEDGTFTIDFKAPRGIKIESDELPLPLNVNWCRWDKALEDFKSLGETTQYRLSDITKKIHTHLDDLTELPETLLGFAQWSETLSDGSDKKIAIIAMMTTIDFMASRHDKTNDWKWKRNSYKYLLEELPYFLWVLLNPSKHFIYPLDSGCSPVVVAFLKLLAKDFNIEEKIILTTTTTGHEIASKWHSSGRGSILKKATPIDASSASKDKPKTVVSGKMDTPINETTVAKPDKPQISPKLTFDKNQGAIFPPSRTNSAPPVLLNKKDSRTIGDSKRRSSAPGRLQTFFMQQYQSLLELQEEAEEIPADKMKILMTLTSAHLEYMKTVQALLQQPAPSVEQQTFIAETSTTSNDIVCKR